MALTLVELGATDWSVFADVSPQMNVYVTPEFTADTGGAGRYLCVMRNGRIVAGSVVGSRQAAPWLAQNSLVLSVAEHERSRRGSFGHAVAMQTLLAAVLVQHPDVARFSFHPSILDTRAAQWALDDRGLRHEWRPRFTGLVHPGGSPRASTRRAAERADMTQINLGPTGTVDDLRSTILGSGITALTEDIEWITACSERMAARGWATVWHAWDRTDPGTRATWLVLRWREVTHLVFGAVAGDGPSRRVIGAALHRAMFRHAFATGSSVVDLMGANDRARAEYKSGWMTHLVRYLEVDWAVTESPAPAT